jgi:hypothetical protein
MFLLDLAKALDANKVPYAIAGGVAVALHGAVRGTVDVDLVIATTESAFTAIEKALNSLGLKSRLPLKASEVSAFRKEYIKNRNLIAWSFINHKNPAQVVDIIITHDLRRMQVTHVSIRGQRIPILNRKSLIKMKKEAGRPQDIEDIKALEALDEKS